MEEFLRMHEDASLFINENPKEAHGIMILGKCPPDISEELIRRYPVAISIDRNPMEHKMDEIVCNCSHAAVLAVEYLIELGHKNIAYIGDCNTESRYMGYYECLLSHKIPLTYDYIIPTNQTKEDGYRAFYEILAKANAPLQYFVPMTLLHWAFYVPCQLIVRESSGVHI